MDARHIGPLIGLLAAVACLTTVIGSAPAKEAGTPSWKDEHAHGFVGCLTQEAASPHYFDLVDAKSDEGAQVGTLRLTGHFLGIDDPKDSLDKRIHVTGVYLGRAPGDPGSGSILLTDDARLVEDKCP